MRPSTDSYQSLAREVADRLSQYPIETHPLMQQLLVGTVMQHQYGDGNSSWRYANHYDLVLDLGTLRHVRPLPGDDLRHMVPNECYGNALLGADVEGYRYVEGFAMTDFLMMNHAWLEDAEGRVVDPTWHPLLKKGLHFTYYGIAFDTAFVHDRAIATGWTSVLRSEWRIGHPILRQGLVMSNGVAIGLGAS